MTHYDFDPGVRGIRGRWPDPPEYWSYTTLRDIRTCPRRWSLKRAQYPDLWQGRGYPPRPGVAALAGTAVHRCLELILEAFATADCEGPRDPKSIQVLRSLGGFSELIQRALEDVLVDLSDNPRMRRSLPAIRTSLFRQVSDLRICLQSLVTRMDIAPAGPSGSGSTDTSSGTLRRGSYAEVGLKADDPPLRGVADLVTVTEEACSIVDYKTGSEHEEHEEQLRFYQALWMLDSRRNPDQVPVSNLEVIYPDRVRSVAPLGADELNAYVEDLKGQTDRLRDETARRPPRALPSPENCSYCTVRHLCGDYWYSEVLSKSFPTEGFGDALVRVLRREGERSWRVAHAPSGVETLLHVAVDDVALAPENLVRLVDAAFSGSDPEAPPTITLTTLTESYVLS